MNWKTKLKQLCYADGRLNYVVTIDFIEKLITADKQLLTNTKKEKNSSKDKLLNSLTDEIGFIEDYAYKQGFTRKLKVSNQYDKSLANHKTKAFKIINELRVNSEFPKIVKDKQGEDFSKFLESEGYEVVTVKDVEKDIKRVHKNNNLTLKK